MRKHSTVKTVSIISEGTLKKNDECWKWCLQGSFKCVRFIGTGKIEHYLQMMMMCRGTMDIDFSVHACYVSEISWYISVVCTMTGLGWTSGKL